MKRLKHEEKFMLMVPDSPITSMSGKSFWRKSRTFWTPLETMFIPMASPVLQLNLTYKFFPAIAGLIVCNLANLLDLHVCTYTPTKIPSINQHHE